MLIFAIGTKQCNYICMYTYINQLIHPFIYLFITGLENSAGDA